MYKEMRADEWDYESKNSFLIKDGINVGNYYNICIQDIILVYDEDRKPTLKTSYV